MILRNFIFFLALFSVFLSACFQAKEPCKKDTECPSNTFCKDGYCLHNCYKLGTQKNGECYECNPGDKKPCEAPKSPYQICSKESKTAYLSQFGLCRPGYKLCVDGKFEESCRDVIVPTCESEPADHCNDRLDNDCDGLVENGCQCQQNTPADQKPRCEANTNDLASLPYKIVYDKDFVYCKKGYMTCNTNTSQWSEPCEGGTTFTFEKEICNGIDDNCNGSIDLDKSNTFVSRFPDEANTLGIYAHTIDQELADPNLHCMADSDGKIFVGGKCPAFADERENICRFYDSAWFCVQDPKLSSCDGVNLEMTCKEYIKNDPSVTPKETTRKKCYKFDEQCRLVKQDGEDTFSGCGFIDCSGYYIREGENCYHRLSIDDSLCINGECQSQQACNSQGRGEIQQGIGECQRLREGSCNGNNPGIYENVPSGQDPNGNCKGFCEDYQSGPSSITSGTCNGNGSCTSSDPCGNNLKCTDDHQSCRMSCSSDNHCISGYYCNSGGVCVPKKDLSDNCSADKQCNSGYCEGNFCCNQPCTGECSDCSSGTCNNNKYKCNSSDPCVISSNISCVNGKCQWGDPKECSTPPDPHCGGTDNKTIVKYAHYTCKNSTDCNNVDYNAAAEDQICPFACDHAECVTIDCCAGKSPPTCQTTPGSCGTDGTTCVWTNANNDTVCNDNNNCTSSDTCQNGQCKGIGQTCDIPPNTKCYEPQGSCDANGECKYTPKSLGFQCNDNDACTESDQCDGNGNCLGAQKNCNNPPECTADGKVKEYTGVCNAGSCEVTETPCSEGQTCNNGQCQ